MNKNFTIKSVYGIVLLLAILVISVIFSLLLGSVKIDLNSFLNALIMSEGYNAESVIIYNIRLPRVVGAVLAGVGLSVSGVLLQGVTGNDLAGPNIIGINAGAGFAVIFSMCFFNISAVIMPFVAFVGAFLTTLLIVLISSKVNKLKSTVILVGIALTSILNAGISFISLIEPDILTSYNYFSIGGLSGVQLNSLFVPAIIIFLCLTISVLFSRQIDVLCLGDSLAYSLGINVVGFRMICLILASALAAAVVSFAGLLGFVGLIVPHIAKQLVGRSMRMSIIVSAIIGAIIVVVADMLGRFLFAPTELPVGIIMALTGAPFFFWLLFKRRNYAVS